MRWYCVHPSLPLQAELRIRVAPDSSAAERCRISQGRAIAACSPVFQVPGSDAEFASWLQVAYLDATSGETEGGFMMAALPDGMALVTPWEETDFDCCCEVRDPAALLYNGPQETAKSLGAVPNINFLYCVVEGGGSRVRILHPEFESVWIDKNDLQIVCARLKHQECSTLHTFYELSEALPEEAQIAIREFPSKEAQTVGLLSRGETLEVTVRGGNWLQIAGGSVDKAWIMWRTDALELLQEAADVCSSTCKRIPTNVDDTANGSAEEDHVGTADNQTEVPFPDTVDPDMVSVIGDEIEGEQIVDDESYAAATIVSATAIQPAQMAPEEVVTHDSNAADPAPDMNGTAALTYADGGDDDTGGPAVNDDEAEEAEPVQAVPAWDDRPIRPAPTAFDAPGDADNSSAAQGGELQDTQSVQATPSWDDRPIQPAQMAPEEVVTDDSNAADPAPDMNGTAALTYADGGDDDTGGPAVNDDEAEEAEPVQAVPAWDDRPIRPAPTAFDAPGDADNSSAAQGGELQDTQSVQATPSWDDRPIQPAQMAPEEVVTDDSNAADPAPDMNGTAALTYADGGDDDTGGPAVNDDEAEEAEPVQAVPAWDDRPIRPAPTAFDAPGDADNSSAAQGGELQDTQSVQATPSWDDRPIQPAQMAPEEVVTDDSNAADPAPDMNGTAALTYADGGDDDTGGPAVNDDEAEEAEPVQAVPAWDDRPIRPAPTAFDAPGDADNSSAAQGGELQDTQSVQATPSWDDRPIQPAQMAPEEVVTDDSNAADPAPDMNGTAALTYADGGDDDTGGPAVNDDEAEEAEPVQAVPAWDDRPIRPAPTAFDAPGDADNSSAAQGGELQDTQSVQATPSWDDRPIQPAQMAPEEVVTDDSNAADPAPDMNGTAALTYADGGDDDTGGPAVNDDEAEEAEPVQAVPAWDDRPIRPAPTAFDAPGDADNSSAAQGGELQDTQSVQATPSWDDRPIQPARGLPIEGSGGDRIRGVDAVDKKVQPTNDCSFGWPTENVDGNSVGVGLPRTQDRQYPNPMNPLGAFERRYAESETTSGSESGEIALLGSLEDVFDPVDELLPAMPEEYVQGVDNDSLRLSSTAVSENMPADAAIAERVEWSDGDGDLHGTGLAQDEAHGENTSPTDGISYLQYVGIRKYCEHKQSLSAPSDELSQAIYEAGQDDSDLIFQALVGDAPLSDDWFHDVTSRNRLAESHSRVSSASAQSLTRSPRISSGSGPKSTYELIMSDAPPEEILESELLDQEDEDYDLIDFPSNRSECNNTSEEAIPGSVCSHAGQT
ncbi:hypothetical protein PRNP1_007488 [Phytophthora ramorum]